MKARPGSGHLQFFENRETRAPRCFLASAVGSEERVSESRALCLSEYLAEEVPAQPLEDRGQQEVVESDRLGSQVDGIVSGKGLCFPFSPNNGNPDHLDTDVTKPMRTGTLSPTWPWSKSTSAVASEPSVSRE